MDVTNTGNGERGTGNRERESGNECTAVTRLIIQNGGRRKRRKCHGCKGEFLPAVHTGDSTFFL